MHRRDGKLIVAATDLVGFLNCGHLTRLDRAAAAGLIRKPDRSEDPEVELLQRRGHAHEQRYVEELKREGRTITDLSADRDKMSYEELAARTHEAMRRGDDVIYQATVFDGRWIGFPDFLLRVNTPSAGRVTRPIDSGGNAHPGPANEFHPAERDAMRPIDSGENVPPETPERTRDNTGLGRDWHYEIADTKLARVAKASALIQIASYVEQIARIEGKQPEKVYVVTGGPTIEVHPYRTAEMMAYFRHAKRRFEDAISEATQGAATYPIDPATSYPDPVEHCAVCKYFPDYCKPQWRRDDALPLVAGISRSQRQTLTGNNTTTMTALSELTEPINFEGLKTAQKESLWRAREQARLQVATGTNKVPVYELLQPESDSAGVLVSDRGLSALPEPSETDLFFDIEGDPFAFWEGLEYLFGIWQKPKGGAGLWDQDGYLGFWAMNRSEEKRAFERVIDLFIERWRANPVMHIYHYGVYEPAHLKILAGRHGTREEELDQLLRGRVFVDLYRVVRQGVRVGAERYSIKNLEPLYGYTREIDLRDANSSIVEFESILEVGDPSGETRAKIEAYNRDDCRSTELLRNWLEARRVDAAATWGELPRAPQGEQLAPDSELSEKQQRVRDLEERLTASITKIETEQTPTDKATWLVRHLLDWHRREEKATWWHYYDLMAKSDDDLVFEDDAVAHLEPGDRYDPGGRSRSYVYRYTFPQQEVDIKLGYVDDPQLGHHKTTGEVVALDTDAATLEIRRAKTWAGPHPNSIVQVIKFPPTDQQNSLFSFGEWVAENGVDSAAPDWHAARDLLLRKPPRVIGRPVRVDGESGTAAALQLATRLDGTTLAIQGPPGSGKTYTGARMVHELVKAGKRVGIASNSHKVISNFVEAVLDAGAVDIVQKGKSHEVFDHPRVHAADKNGEVRDALESGTAVVAAGTAWVWSSPDLADAVDTLFVDEAGQMSLANVVAMSGAARNIVLLGDPQQLDQPTQGAHPEGAGVSALAHLLGSLEVVPPNRGLFLEKTWRMHPQITEFTSELFYEGKLHSVMGEGLERQVVLGNDEWSGSGLRWVPVAHDGRTNASPEEADRVCEIWNSLVGRAWMDRNGVERLIGPDDIVIVSPFNAHRLLIKDRLPQARVGTVDKFQGQEAAVSIYTMATSRPEDAPRGMNFLYSLNRLNVATSRARALAIVVANPRLLAVLPGTPAQLQMANGLAAYAEAGEPVTL
jgi:predicted RecB family nuclease